ncbi:hypothetical protein [Flavobacterium sp. UBA4197]|uniref:hypothetical protein n=1 Tax=Flavobacterium sp. UBA4197 TaxID=1946546 RepID=UPI00257E9CEA|nr:hypothetical protein [Flavobacterium sp. UBA4197]HRB72434.1 hypothetical protein [Flavobacterium sp.]
MNTKEEVINFRVPAGSSYDFFSSKLVSGCLVGVVIYHNNQDGDFIQAALKDDSGIEICKMQHLENYRSRNASYLEGCKPLPMDPLGKTYTLEIKALEPLRNDLVGQMIFIYSN